MGWYRGILAAFIFLITLHSAEAITIEDYRSSFNYSIRFTSVNVTSYSDYMIDSDDDTIPDLFIINLSFNSSPGTYILFADVLNNGSLVTLSTTKVASNPNSLQFNVTTTHFEGEQ